MSTHRNTAIVTGVGSGIGLAVAEAFARADINVVPNGRSEDKLTQAMERIGSPEQVALAVDDVTRLENADQIVEVAVKRFGGVDIRVTSAVIFYTKPFTDFRSVNSAGSRNPRNRSAPMRPTRSLKPIRSAKFARSVKDSGHSREFRDNRVQLSFLHRVQSRSSPYDAHRSRGHRLYGVDSLSGVEAGQ